MAVENVARPASVSSRDVLSLLILLPQPVHFDPELTGHVCQPLGGDPDSSSMVPLLTVYRELLGQPGRLQLPDHGAQNVQLTLIYILSNAKSGEP